jgi:HlyD family secretion protein
MKGASASSESNGLAKKQKRKKRRKWIIPVTACILIIAVFTIVRNFRVRSNSLAAATTYSVYAAEKRDISVTLSGSGTLKPADSYSVTSLVSGEILSDTFEEGDTVKEGDVLYQIDTADVETSIRSAELNLEKAQLQYNNLLESLGNLRVKAPVDGSITSLDVEVGDEVSAGQKIGSVRNSATMRLMVPFNSADADSFAVGESAEVTLDSTFETLYGTVSKISGVEEVLPGNMLVKYVTIEVINPGGITDSTVATAKIGDIACSGSAAFGYKGEQSITAKTSGTVVSLSADEGDFVQKNAVILTLENRDIEQNVKNSELSLEEAKNALENKKKALEDYTITSPIAGTVIEKNTKAGDKLDVNSGGTALCTIYDLSYLTMELSVDELDISSVKVGQEVSITADAVEGKTFTGKVTKVNINGTTSNGVTAYPVTVRIDETGGLLPGMNVDASIILQSVSDVLSVPVDAVMRGNMVLVKTDSSVAAHAGETLPADKGGLPKGFEFVQVTLGVNNDDFIEIESGLQEGDIIAVQRVNTDTGALAGFGGMAGNGRSGNMEGGYGGGNAGGGPPEGGGVPIQ